MNLEIPCKCCGKAFTASRSELLQGPQYYQCCAACRERKPAATCRGCGRPLLATGRHRCVHHAWAQ
jgi:hypothetical protein